MKEKEVHSSKKQKNKIEQSKIIRNRILIVASILLVIAVILCLYKVIIFVQNPTDTFTVEQGKIYQEERAIGYIIREETIVKGSNYKNGMEQIKSEGEKVAKGEAIFRYYSSGEENLVKKIRELDTKIDVAMAKA